MLKSENIQKSDKTPKIIRKNTFLDLMAFYLILFTIWITAQLYIVNLNYLIIMIKLK